MLDLLVLSFQFLIMFLLAKGIAAGKGSVEGEQLGLFELRRGPEIAPKKERALKGNRRGANDA